MFLNDSDFYNLIKKGVVGSECTDDFEIESGGLDLTIDRLFIIGSRSRRNMGGFLGRHWRKLPEQREVLPTDFKSIPVPILESYSVTREERQQLLDTGTELVWVIESGTCYAVQTTETTINPLECLGLLGERRTLIMMGAILTLTFVSPGYEGRLMFGLHHMGPSFLLEHGAPIVAYRLAEVRKGGESYKGKVWKGDVVAPKGLVVGR